MEEKKWYESKAIWGAILTFAVLVLGFFGYNVLPEDQATLVEILGTLGGFITTVVAIVGRIKASKKIVA